MRGRQKQTDRKTLRLTERLIDRQRCGGNCCAQKAAGTRVPLALECPQVDVPWPDPMMRLPQACSHLGQIYFWLLSSIARPEAITAVRSSCISTT